MNIVLNNTCYTVKYIYVGKNTLGKENSALYRKMV